MTRARHAIAVVLVATALCADRSTVSAAPVSGSQHQPSAASQTSSLAARFVSRISAGFRRAVPGVTIIYQAREGNVAQPPSAVGLGKAQSRAAEQYQPQQFSPFQFRL